MLKRKKQEQENQLMNSDENVKEPTFLRKKSIKELIAPSGIDASNIDHLEIISNVKRYARSFYVSSLPRSCIFPELFRSLYMFGDINTSIYIKPISEATSQNELNKKNLSDFIINNNGSFDELESQVKTILNQIIKN